MIESVRRYVSGGLLLLLAMLRACGVRHTGALILLGDSNNTSAKSYSVRRVKIKDREIVFR